MYENVTVIEIQDLLPRLKDHALNVLLESDAPHISKDGIELVLSRMVQQWFERNLRDYLYLVIQTDPTELNVLSIKRFKLPSSFFEEQTAITELWERTRNYLNPNFNAGFYNPCQINLEAGCLFVKFAQTKRIR